MQVLKPQESDLRAPEVCRHWNCGIGTAGAGGASAEAAGIGTTCAGDVSTRFASHGTLRPTDRELNCPVMYLLLTYIG
jgi:hypothetical protein